MMISSQFRVDMNGQEEQEGALLCSQDMALRWPESNVEKRGCCFGEEEARIVEGRETVIVLQLLKEQRTAATGELSCRSVGQPSPAATKSGQSFVLLQVRAELRQWISAT
jgi:hypothetical protein